MQTYLRNNIFSERLLLLFSLLKYKSANEFAIKGLGYTSSEKINRLIREPENSPSYEILSDIANKFVNVNMNWLITGDGEPLKIAAIPAANVAANDKSAPENIMHLMPRVITVDKENNELIALVAAKAAAGYLNGYSDAEFIESLPSLSLPGYAGLSHRAFEVRGQSMLPTHHSGSIAIGRAVENLNDIRDRRVYIVVTKTDGIVLKRVLNRIKDDGKLILLSDNDNKKEYPNYPIDADDVLELWYWRGSLIRESPEPGGVYNRINDMEARLTLLQNSVLQIAASNKGLSSGI